MIIPKKGKVLRGFVALWVVVFCHKNQQREKKKKHEEWTGFRFHDLGSAQRTTRFPHGIVLQFVNAKLVNTTPIFLGLMNGSFI